MKNIFYFLLLIITISCQTTTETNSTENEYNIIPQPLKLEAQEGVFLLKKDLSIFVSDAVLQPVAAFLELGTAQVKTIAKEGAENAIIFQLDNSMNSESAYTLSVNSKRIRVTSKNAKGAFYAVQTLQQLMQNQGIPAVEIKDEARFSYRGMHLDVSRHFFPVSTVKQFIDLLAYHKINRFHWHLTDDQGWRIEIKKYPKLTEIAAFRKETLIGHYNDQPHQFDGKRYGGFYTQEEVKDVVQYAAERFITIVPEIEMPGHSQAVLAAYPEFACTEGPFEVGTKGGVFDDVLCPKEATFEFLENVLIEVMDLFPSKYIHIGGDECPKIRWEESAFCQKLMKKEGLKDAHELQSYFITRMEKFLNSKGRNIIGWDEILEGGLAPNASVMSWRGTQGGIDAAQQGHDVVMTPTSHCYFDYYQSQSPDEPLAIGGFLPLQKVYDYEPIPEVLTTEEAQHILGLQGNIWTEYIPTSDKLFYMMFPRACALAEVAWSAKSNKDYADFTRRLLPHLERLKAMGVTSANHLYDVQLQIKAGEGTGITAILSKEVEAGNIRYTLDGTAPNTQSSIYKEVLSIEKSLVLRAQTFMDERQIGNSARQTFDWHKAVGKKIAFEHQPHEKYSGNGAGSVINGVLGNSERYGGSEWLGFEGKDVVCVIDFGQKETIQQLKTRFFKGEGQWIYLPKSLEVFSSDDGENFTSIAKSSKVEGVDKTVVHNLDIPATEAQFFKIKVSNFGLIPAGAQGAGHEAWLFMDELIVK